MARPHRPAPDHLNHFRLAAAHVRSLSPLALLRGAEARAPGLPRFGASSLPEQDIVELAQTPSMAFPASTLESIRVGERRARVEGHWFGLTGPMGPLPLHLSEFASYERRYSKRQPYGGFLDLLAGRMLQFFYRVWAVTSPVASVDRVADDHFGDRIAALTGAEEGVGADACLPARARLRYAGLFASMRSPAGIQDALQDLMRLPIRLEEFIPRWRDVAPTDRTRIGRALGVLGGDAVAGGRIRTASDAFRVVVSVDDAKVLVEMLPGGRRYRLIVEALDAFAPSHLEWDIQLSVAGEAVRPARLGGGNRLGWTAWTGPRSASTVSADARLGASSRRISRSILDNPET